VVICPTRRDYIYIALGLEDPSGLLPNSLLYRLDFLHDFVQNHTFGCMEAFMIASISFPWLE
jgi:hypothetical protein